MWFLNEKKRHFKRKIANVRANLYDLEFNRSKLKMLREQVRQEYDRLNETSEAAQKALEKKKAEAAPDQGVIENLTKLVEKYAPDLEYMRKQMQGLEDAICTEATDEKGNPLGINQRIEAVRSMKQMLTEYLRSL